MNKLSINLVIKGALYNGRLGAYIMLRDKGPNGIREIPWDLLDGLEGSDVVHKLKEKELLEFECKSFQIRQVGVNEDPFDPMLAGARTADKLLLTPMMGFASGRFFIGLESSSKVGYSQMDRLRNL
ncbi:hypothetical protein IGI04_014027 [Brassica rapa subsp. trilocularis]|uniref:Uncharacterized protein n=1 Tax=Brassica rapa subsp. trilocularis TaxID=1813537 RepID=A0ABQ7NB52_BRACM|nr:hypothetical protein IGI04_014027 [Brassica rapa subsp. trilocularis]